MAREVVFLHHANTIDLLLMADGSPATLSGMTKMTITLGRTTIESSNAATASILWSKAGYDQGEIRLRLFNHPDLTPRVYNSPLVVYDATYASGLVWDYIDLEVRKDVEA